MAQLIVNRKSNFVNSARSYKVFLNDQVVGEVKNGKSTEIDMPAGEYSLRSGISAFSGMSPTIQIQLSDEKLTTAEVGVSTAGFMLSFLTAVISFFLINLFRGNIIVLVVGLVATGFSLFHFYKNGSGLYIKEV
jgi:hypothetical protein